MRLTYKEKTLQIYKKKTTLHDNQIGALQGTASNHSGRIISLENTSASHGVRITNLEDVSDGLLECNYTPFKRTLTSTNNIRL